MFLEFLAADGTVIPFPSLKFRVGTAASCEVRLDGLDPQHVEIWSENGGNNWKLRALCSSAEGLVVNGAPLRESRVSPGFKLRLGAVALEVRLTRATPTGVAMEGTLVRTPVLESGTIIDNRYEILERIASGGMGQVYRAVHIELRKPLAVKVMLPSLSQNQDFVARFKREAIAVSRIGQENIVDVSDFGRTVDGRFFFVMELVDGLTVARQLRQDGPFTPARTVRVGTQVARALAAAHAAGVVHRDLKPENIMLVQRPSQPDFVKVLDFGVAKVEASGTTGFGGQTAVGMLVGTPQYMPPEQAQGLTIDGRTDVYALGLIMHELLMGRPCFRGDTTPALIMMQLHAEPAPLALPGMPEGLEPLIMQMLKKKPEERPTSMVEVLMRLAALAAHAAALPRPAPAPVFIDPSAAATVRMEGLPETRLAPLTALVPAETLAAPKSVAETNEPPSSVLVSPDLQPTRKLRTPVKRSPNAPEPVPSPPRGKPVDEPLVVARSRAPFVIFVVAALVVVGLVAFVVTQPSLPTHQGPTPPEVERRPVLPAPPPREPAVPERVKLVLNSAPAGAEVYEADVMLGTTPITLQRTADAVAELRFELQGYETVSRKVAFAAEQSLTITLEPVRRVVPPKPPKTPRPPTGELKEAPF